jgi:predicted small secreted protein
LLYDKLNILRGRVEMKKRILFALVIVCIALLSACSTTPTTPEDVLLAFNKSMDDDNLDEALSYIADDIYFKFLDEYLYTSKDDELVLFLKLYMVLYSDSKLLNLETDGNTVNATLELKGLGDRFLLGPLRVVVENNQITEYIF